jgi:hypothetical protein
MLALFGELSFDSVICTGDRFVDPPASICCQMTSRGQPLGSFTQLQRTLGFSARGVAEDLIGETERSHHALRDERLPAW